MFVSEAGKTGDGQVKDEDDDRRIMMLFLLYYYVAYKKGNIHYLKSSLYDDLATR